MPSPNERFNRIQVKKTNLLLKQAGGIWISISLKQKTRGLLGF